MTGIPTTEVRLKEETLINKRSRSGSNKGHERQLGIRGPSASAGGKKTDNAAAEQLPREAIDFNFDFKGRFPLVFTPF